MKFAGCRCHRSDSWSRCLLPCIFLLVVSAGGCGDGLRSDRLVPAPLPDKYPYQFSGKIRRILGADNFEILDENVVHFVVLEDVTAAPKNHPFHQPAMALLRSLTGDQQITFQVTERDEFQRERGHILIGEQDLAIRLLEAGAVKVDFELNGTDPESLDERQRRYLRAERSAREKQLGLWATGSSG